VPRQTGLANGQYANKNANRDVAEREPGVIDDEKKESLFSMIFLGGLEFPRRRLKIRNIYATFSFFYLPSSVIFYFQPSFIFIAVEHCQGRPWTMSRRQYRSNRICLAQSCHGTQKEPDQQRMRSIIRSCKKSVATSVPSSHPDLPSSIPSLSFFSTFFFSNSHTDRVPE